MLRSRLQEYGQKAVGAEIGVHPITLNKAAAGLGVQRAVAAHITTRIRELMGMTATAAA